MSDDSSSKLSQQRRVGVALLTLCATIFLFFAAQIVAELLIVLVLDLSGKRGSIADDSIGLQFTYSLLADSLLVAGIALLLYRLHWSWRTIGLKMPKIWHLVLGALAAVPYYVLLLIVVSVVGAFVPSLNVNQKQELGFDGVYGLLPTILTFVSLVVLPPLAEEIVMRGFLYTGLRTWLPRVLAALLVSGLFGAAHLAEGGSSGPLWVGAIDTFTLSLVLVRLREKTGNLWAGITLHALKNGIAFAVLFLHPHFL